MTGKPVTRSVILEEGRSKWKRVLGALRDHPGISVG
jgi:hypothetical protein